MLQLSLFEGSLKDGRSFATCTIKPRNRCHFLLPVALERDNPSAALRGKFVTDQMDKSDSGLTERQLCPWPLAAFSEIDNLHQRQSMLGGRRWL